MGLKEEGVPYPPHQGLLYSETSPAGESWQLAMKNQLLFLFLLSADLTHEISLPAAEYKGKNNKDLNTDVVV